MARTTYLHQAGCTCRTCTPRFVKSWRRKLAIKVAARALIILFALISIPFLILQHLANTKGGR